MGKIKVGDVAGGAATGAAVGSIVPGVGTAIGAGVGAIGGGLYDLFASDDPGPSATDIAAQQKLDAMKMAAGQLQAYRPIAAQNRMQGMNNQLGLFQGAMNTMQSMYGGQPPPAMRPMGPGGLRMPGDVPGALAAHQSPPMLAPRQGAPLGPTMGAPTFPQAQRPIPGPLNRPVPRPPTLDSAISQLGGGR